MTRQWWRGPARAGLLFTCLLALFTWSDAGAQTVTGSIRGRVLNEAGDPVPTAQITARNVATNVERTTISNDQGMYMLVGLQPATYEISVNVIGYSASARQVRVLVGQSLNADLQLSPQAIQLTGITVVGQRAVETRTSEIATNVTEEQIQSLPTSDRNFLSLAQLAPGVQLQGDRVDATRKTITANGQLAEQINVFIDGASYKNDILKGGVAGQDASRGNPFPRNAVGEFRVITQNFKAEYQKASSAIITATTRSGTNQWQSQGFLNYQHEGLTDLDHFQAIERDTARARDEPFTRPDFNRYQMGVNAGGPILRDRLFFFGSYEGNRQNRARRVEIIPPEGFPALDRFDFASRSGEFDEPFRSTLIFGKMNFSHTPVSQVELSYHHRHENDVRDFGGLTAYETGTRFKNDVNTAVLKHTWTPGTFLNEATASFQRYRYNPSPVASGTSNLFFGFGCCAQIGANISEQDFTQKRLALRNDVTWAGFQAGGDHVIKVGANLDFLNYDIIKRNNENPRFVFEPWFNEFAIPHRVEFQFGQSEFESSNTQFGIYAQDDWSPIERLTLNLGVRWDYESKMINTDYVTPQAIRDSLTKYQDRLFLPLEDRYFADGNRSPFYGAIQPRLGFSYSLDQAARTTVFGGWGIFYDRTLYDLAVEEEFAEQRPRYNIGFVPPGEEPGSGQLVWEERFLTEGRDALVELTAGRSGFGREVKLLPNDLKPPKAQHFNVGVRQAFGTLAASATYVGVRSKDIPTFSWADRGFVCPERSFAVEGCFQERGIPGYGVILMADNTGRTWYNALQLKLDRPYVRSDEDFGWGFGVAYSLGKREKAGFNDDFSFPQYTDYGRQRSNDEQHRVVTNWVVDMPWVWGIQFSGVATYGSGTRYDIGDRFGTLFQPGEFEGDDYRMVDLRFRKDLPSFYGGRVGVVAELFNAFNNTNFGGYILPQNLEDPNFGRATSVISDPRRLQFGLEYGF
jgi:hypothetical protein